MKKPANQGTAKNSRMSGVLICLFVSMTLGAVFLDWMRPGRAAIGTAAGVPLMARTAWQGIRIESYQPRSGARPEDSHFVVDRDGRYVETVSWHSQRALGAAKVVRIGLLVDRESDALTPAQENTAVYLADWLQSKYGLSSQEVVWMAGPGRSNPRPS